MLDYCFRVHIQGSHILGNFHHLCVSLSAPSAMETLDSSTGLSEAYPDRGLKAYSVVLGAWLVLFPASGLLNSTGIFQAWLLEHQLQEYPESKIAWIFSIFAFLFFFGGLGVGERYLL
jgi:hypothetical protein